MNSSEDLNPILFVSRQLRNTIAKDITLLQSQIIDDQTTGNHEESASMMDSINSKLFLGQTFEVKDSRASLSITKNELDIFSEENLGVCAIIEMMDYTELLMSIKDKVPVQIITKSLEGMISKVN